MCYFHDFLINIYCRRNMGHYFLGNPCTMSSNDTHSTVEYLSVSNRTLLIFLALKAATVLMEFFCKLLSSDKIRGSYHSDMGKGARITQY
jgi:hypothetical protein